MKIKEITIENFKSFKGSHTFLISEKMNFIVGENNTGKTTLFEAISFLQNGIPKGKELGDIKNKSCSDNDNMGVTLKLQGNINQIIDNFSQEKFKSHVFEDDGIETILLRRQSQQSSWTDSKGGKKTLSIKDLGVWNEEEKEFQNPSGFSAAFKTLFDCQFIWADTNSEDILDFGSTKICGRLLNIIAKDFFSSPEYQDFKQEHYSIFQDKENKKSLSNRVSGLESELESLLKEQYGEVGISFDFQMPDDSNFLKIGDIELDDGVKTSKSEKGSGLQRTLALSLMQLYASKEAQHIDNDDIIKPLMFFIDEPETYLHPRAQDKLINSFKELSKKHQIFITTHSPYLLKSFSGDENKLLIFEKTDCESRHKDISQEFSLFKTETPSWGEINYFAYKICWPEFHNELYGYIQAQDDSYANENGLENYLVSKKIAKTKEWKREFKGIVKEPYPVTLQTYIRNSIHHPENTNNDTYTYDDLVKSTEEMIRLIKEEF